MQTESLESDRYGAAGRNVASELVAGYGGGEEEPLGGYAVLLGAYAVAFGGSLALVRKRLPRRYSLGDILLLGVATHNLARMIAKDRVTSPIRAPFVRYQGPAGAGELSEKSRGRGMRRAMGHLLTCPYCMAPWAGGALLVGAAAKPRLTRSICVLATAITVSGFLNQALAAIKKA